MQGFFLPCMRSSPPYCAADRPGRGMPLLGSPRAVAPSGVWAPSRPTRARSPGDPLPAEMHGNKPVGLAPGEAAAAQYPRNRDPDDPPALPNAQGSGLAPEMRCWPAICASSRCGWPPLEARCGAGSVPILGPALPTAEGTGVCPASMQARHVQPPMTWDLSGAATGAA